MTAKERVLRRSTVVGYAIGSLGTGGFATLPGLVLVFYLTDTLGVGALMAGLMVTVAKIWDVVIDPVIGATSDRALLHRGTRRGFMRWGGLLLPVFFVLTFAVPAGLEPTASGLWVLGAFLLTATAFSLFQVPYIALPAEIADGYDQRTRLLTWRVVVLTFAILLFGAGGPLLRKLGGDNDYLGYLIMAIVAGVVIGVGMLISSRVAPRGVRLAAPASGLAGAGAPRLNIRQHYVAGFAVLRRSQSFRALLATFMLQGLATGVMLAGANYVAVWVLHSEDALTFIFVALIAPAILFAPLWGVVARRVGKERGFVLASMLFGIAALALIGMLWAPGPWIYIPVALAGAGYAGMQSLPMAMLPDVISHDAEHNGSGQAGTFSGVWTAGETTGMALGATALTIVLASTGYIESVGGVTVAQSTAAIDGIILSFSVLPAVLIGLSLLTLRGYSLRKEDIDTSHNTDTSEVPA